MCNDQTYFLIVAKANKLLSVQIVNNLIC